jgi:predicted Fe-Mo cluster-binding NifX family protein
MKTAFAIWDNRIAPVFDTALQLHLVEAEHGRILAEANELLADDSPMNKTLRLTELGIETLVCGAISKSLHALVVSYGIQVIPFIAGDLHEIIQAWLDGKLAEAKFAMPGCCGRRRGQCADEKVVRKTCGSGRQGNRHGRCIGSTNVRRCLDCGHCESDKSGTVSTQKKCPNCGTVMVRE